MARGAHHGKKEPELVSGEALIIALCAFWAGLVAGYVIRDRRSLRRHRERILRRYFEA
jgi:hypothetical protein